MFTGLIQSTAVVSRQLYTKNNITLAIKPKPPLKKVVLGESIALNGCCLTVVAVKKGELFFDLSEETLDKTTFGHGSIGQLLNLERALKAGDALGGHFVSGHVDGVGSLVAINKKAGSIELTFEAPKNVAIYLVDKGSVTVDGISLTVCLNGQKLKSKTRFKVAIIPHTWQVTNLSHLKIGSAVNLEADLIGKYIVNRNKRSK